MDRLYEPENKLLRLFEPPFENSSKNPGYIQSYGPGFRENGGQYTHGAIWLIMALIKENRQDEALKLIETLIPENHPITQYEAEPYVIAADVYANPDCPGRAGWSWYTGSSGWLLRVICEDLLGLKLNKGKLLVEPRLPSSWKGCEIVYKRKDGAKEEIKIEEGLSKRRILP